MRGLATLMTLALLCAPAQLSAQVVAPYYHDVDEGGWVEFDPVTMETGLVWGYDLGGVTGVWNWDYNSCRLAAEDYAALLADFGFPDEAAVAATYDWRLPTINEIQDAIAKGLFDDVALAYGPPPSETVFDHYFAWHVMRATSEKRGKRGYWVVPETGEVLLFSGYGIPIVVRADTGAPDDGGGNGNGNGNGNGHGNNK